MLFILMMLGSSGSLSWIGSRNSNCTDELRRQTMSLAYHDWALSYGFNLVLTLVR
jgi:hypothetical protein